VRAAVTLDGSFHPAHLPLDLQRQMCRRRDAKNNGGTSDRAVRRRRLTKPQSRHLHLGGVHMVDRSDDFRAAYSVGAYLHQLSVDWQSEDLSDARPKMRKILTEPSAKVSTTSYSMVHLQQTAGSIGDEASELVTVVDLLLLPGRRSRFP